MYYSSAQTALVFLLHVECIIVALLACIPEALASVEWPLPPALWVNPGLLPLGPVITTQGPGVLPGQD